MTRRLSERSRRRLARIRPVPRRSEHGLALALAGPPDGPQRDADSGQRADQRALRALAEENATLARELGRVQARCTQWRNDCIVQAERLQASLVRARGECIVKETRLAATLETLDALRRRATAWLTSEELVRRVADLGARNRALEDELGTTRQRLAAASQAHGLATAEPSTRLPEPRAAARCVLCVGGRARQIPVYRELVERTGARFAHIAAADAGCLEQLQSALAQADLVILQPGYVCQRACLAVQAHCARAGVRCVQLDKPCVPGFANSLAEAIAAD